jgi:hypothetical protein
LSLRQAVGDQAGDAAHSGLLLALWQPFHSVAATILSELNKRYLRAMNAEPAGKMARQEGISRLGRTLAIARVEPSRHRPKVAYGVFV